jgi:hypothetical protein
MKNNDPHGRKVRLQIGSTDIYRVLACYIGKGLSMGRSPFKELIILVEAQFPALV